jgi:hypothetical protein
VLRCVDHYCILSIKGDRLKMYDPKRIAIACLAKEISEFSPVHPILVHVSGPSSIEIDIDIHIQGQTTTKEMRDTCHPSL